MTRSANCATNRGASLMRRASSSKTRGLTSRRPGPGWRRRGIFCSGRGSDAPCGTGVVLGHEPADCTSDGILPSTLALTSSGRSPGRRHRGSWVPRSAPRPRDGGGAPPGRRVGIGLVADSAASLDRSRFRDTDRRVEGHHGGADVADLAGRAVIEKLGYTAIMIGIVVYFVLLVAALLVDQRPRWRVSEWVTQYVLSRTRRR